MQDLCVPDEGGSKMGPKAFPRIYIETTRDASTLLFEPNSAMSWGTPGANIAEASALACSLAVSGFRKVKEHVRCESYQWKYNDEGPFLSRLPIDGYGWIPRTVKVDDVRIICRQRGPNVRGLLLTLHSVEHSLIMGVFKVTKGRYCVGVWKYLNLSIVACLELWLLLLSLFEW